MEQIGIFFVILSLCTIAIITLFFLLVPVLQRMGILHSDNRRLKFGIVMAYITSVLLFVLGIGCV